MRPRPAATSSSPSGDVFVTGSSTVEPISILVGELANEMSGGGLAVTVEGPGTGDGFATFCTGGADISDASRPINDEEIAPCEENGVEYVELEVAIDGLTVATSPPTRPITCLDVPALYALVGPESEGFANWSDARSWRPRSLGVRRRLPRRSARHHRSRRGERHVRHVRGVRHRRPRRGAGTGRGHPCRLLLSPNDNLIVEGIEASDSSLGWVGFAYYAAEQERMKAIEIDGGDGCVAPTPETIADGTYPFSRTLYIYVNAANAESNPAVASFVDLYLSPEGLAPGHRCGLRRPAGPDPAPSASTGRLGRPPRPPVRSARAPLKRIEHRVC